MMTPQIVKSSSSQLKEFPECFMWVHKLLILFSAGHLTFSLSCSGLLQCSFYAHAVIAAIGQPSVKQISRSEMVFSLTLL